MVLNRRHFLNVLLAAGLFPGVARSQDANSAKPITILVPYPPGGPGDLMARAVSHTMTERLGRPVIVDYKPGAGGQIAASTLMQQPADGSTLLIAEMSILCSNKFIYQDFRYDPLTDFAAIAPLPQMPIVLYVAADSPYNSIADIVEASKTKPISYASQGFGTVGHLLGEMLAKENPSGYTHVPYKGSSPAMIDTMSGVVDFLFDGIGAGLSHLKTGKLKAIAVAGPARLPQIADVPTTQEAGWPDVSMPVWFGAVARAGTQADVIQRYSEELAYAMSLDENRARFGDLGFQFVSMAPDEFGEFMRSESDRWGSFIQERGIKAD